MDANGKAAGSVEVKVFNKKVCMTADSSYCIRSEGDLFWGLSWERPWKQTKKVDSVNNSCFAGTQS